MRPGLTERPGQPTDRRKDTPTSINVRVRKAWDVRQPPSSQRSTALPQGQSAFSQTLCKRRFRHRVSEVDGRLRTMSTQYYTASSIDGFIADPDNSLDWLFQFSEETGMEDQYPRFIAQVGAMAMGSTTYEWVADHTGFLNDPS